MFLVKKQNGKYNDKQFLIKLHHQKVLQLHLICQILLLGTNIRVIFTNGLQKSTTLLLYLVINDQTEFLSSNYCPGDTDSISSSKRNWSDCCFCNYEVTSRTT